MMIRTGVECPRKKGQSLACLVCCGFIGFIGSYSSRSGGQAQWQSWNWRQGYSGKGWGADDWGRSTGSISSAAPPEPVLPPSTATPVPDSAPTADTSAQEASGSAGGAQQTPMRSPIISEEYCEINGQPHYKRLLADGTIEYESW